MAYTKNKANLTRLPYSLIAVWIIFVILPFIFLFENTWPKTAGLKLTFDLLSLIIIPIALSFLVLKSQLISIPLLLIQTLFWSIRVYWLFPDQDPVARFTSGLLVILCGIILTMMYTFDHLLPTFLNGKKNFRRPERTNVFRLATLRGHSRNVRAMIRNISESGICLSIHRDDLEEILVDSENESIQLDIQAGTSKIQISGYLRWKKAVSDDYDLGIISHENQGLDELRQVIIPPPSLLQLGIKIENGWKSALRPIIYRLWIFICTVMVFVVACADQLHFFHAEDARPQISVNIGTGVSRDLQLAGELNSYRIEVSGCLSGYYKILESGSGPLNLHFQDIGCLAKVLELVYDGMVYTSMTGDFNPDNSATTVFSNQQGKKLYVTVVRQLPQVIDQNPQLIFAINGSETGQSVATTGLEITGINLSIDQLEVIEGVSVQAQLSISRDLFVDKELTVNLSYGGTAVANEDYRTLPNQVTFAAASTTATVPITIFDDNQPEGDETLEIHLATGIGYYTGGKSTGLVIHDDDISTPLTGLAFHYSARSGVVLRQDRVRVWSDQSNLGYDASQNKNAEMPLYESSGLLDLPTIAFDGVDDSFAISSANEINSQGPYNGKSMVVLLKTGTEVQSSQVIYQQGDGIRGLNLHIQGGRLFGTAWNLASDNDRAPWGPVMVSKEVLPENVYLIRFIFDQANGRLTLHSNSVLDHQSDGIGLLFSHNSLIGLGKAAEQTILGDRSIGQSGLNFKGKISEFYYYNRVLADHEAAGIENMLKSSYAYRPQPLTYLTSLDSIAYEGYADPAKVSIQLSQSNPEAVTVNLAYTGTAQSGIDYQSLPEEITIPPFSNSFDLLIEPLNDNEQEDMETITVTITASSIPVGANEVTVLLYDDEVYRPNQDIALWLRSDELTTELGTNLKLWPDQSPNGINVSQNQNPRKPKVALTGETGFAAAHFDGDNDFLSIANHLSINTGGPYHYRVLAMALQTSSDILSPQVIFEQGGSSRGFNLVIENGRLFANFWNLTNDGPYSSWGPAFVDTPIEPDMTYTMLVVFDQLNQKLQLNLNNKQVDLSTDPIGLLYPDQDDINLGGSRNDTIWTNGSRQSNSFFNGAIGELLYFKRPISAIEIDHLQKYLMEKYVP